LSCAENKKAQVSDIPVLKVSDLKAVENPKLDDTSYFDKVEFIILETTDESILGEISQIEVFENHIYILDRKGKSLKKFDLAGKYLHDIGRVGLGTEEYIAVSSFYINPNLKTINIYDPMKRSILQYDFSGKYIKTTKSSNFDLTFAAKLSFIDDNEIFCFSNSNWMANCEFAILNEKLEGECIYEYPVKTDKQISSAIITHPYTVRNGEIHYVLMFSDTVYSYSNNEISKLLLIESGKPALDPEQLSQIASENDNVLSATIIAKACKKGYTTGLKSFFESDSYICCDFYIFTDYAPMAAILWNKTTNKGVYLSKYLNVSPCFGSISYCFDNTFVRIWDGQQIANFKEYVGTLYKKEQFPAKVWEILDNYNEDDDNPILIFFTMKND
jgi:hypothetical protein